MEFAVFLAVVVFFVLLTSVVIVRQGYEYTVESFGRFTRTLSPGGKSGRQNQPHGTGA